MTTLYCSLSLSLSWWNCSTCAAMASDWSAVRGLVNFLPLLLEGNVLLGMRPWEPSGHSGLLPYLHRAKDYGKEPFGKQNMGVPSKCCNCLDALALFPSALLRSTSIELPPLFLRESISLVNISWWAPNVHLVLVRLFHELQYTDGQVSEAILS